MRTPDRTERPEDAALWREFAHAAKPEAFYAAWLALQCRMVRGVRGGVIITRGTGGATLAPAAFWPEEQRDVTAFMEVAERALREGQGLVVRRAVEPTLGDDARYAVAYPAQVDGRIHSIVALDLAARPEPELRAALRQLQWGSAWLELFLRRGTTPAQDGAASPATGERLKALLDLVATALGHERFYTAATAFVTTLATRLSCERVSLGFVARGHVRVRAVSHSAQFGGRTSLMRAIAAAMDEAVDQHTTLCVPAPAGAAPSVIRAHAALAAQERAGAICTVPLVEGTRVVGALTLERPLDQPFDGPTVELCEAIAAVAGPILELQRRDDRWLVGKAAETVRRQLGHLVGPRHVGAKLGVVGVLAVAAVLAFATDEFRVSARTVTEAELRRAVVAPFNGYVREAPVRAGDVVRAGQPLVTLDDRELRLERAKWLSQQEQYVKQHQQALANRNAAQVNITMAQIDQARAQIALLDDQLSKTRVVAAGEGVVVSGDLSQSLGAPVERGQVLFEVAPLDVYRVVLQVDERDIGHVAVGQRGRLLLTAAPADALDFTVKSVTPVSIAREGRNYFRVEAALDRTPARIRPGMEGVGKIDIERRRLVWIWTRQAIDWLRLQAWTWLS